MIVDLPIPGSPEIKVSDPLTIPPPKTLFSSPIPVSILLYSALPIILSLDALLLFPSALVIPLRLLASSSLTSTTFSSTKEFHAPQMHCPSHLGVSYPHSWQTYTDFAFLAISILQTFVLIQSISFPQTHVNKYIKKPPPAMHIIYARLNRGFNFI